MLCSNPWPSSNRENNRTEHQNPTKQSYQKNNYRSKPSCLSSYHEVYEQKMEKEANWTSPENERFRWAWRTEFDLGKHLLSLFFLTNPFLLPSSSFRSFMAVSYLLRTITLVEWCVLARSTLRLWWWIWVVQSRAFGMSCLGIYQNFIKGTIFNND